MRLVFLLVLALTSVSAVKRSASSEDLDSLISKVFTDKPEENSPNVPQDGDQDYSEGAYNTDRVHGEGHGEGEGEGDCECVAYYLCSNNKIVTDGTGLIDIRSGFKSLETACKCSTNNTNAGIKDGPCPNYLDVCCSKPNTIHPGSPVTPNPDHPDTHGTGEEYEHAITPTPITRTGCGQRNPEGVGFRITGDMDGEAQFGEFPWMVALLREETGKKGQKINVYQCGGSLIHHQVVLTAAHCVSKKDPYTLKIRAGEWDTQTKNELFPHQDRQVKKIIIHEQYYAGALYNDVALLILESPVDPAENIDIVCLPQQGEVIDKTRCIASGWGKDVFGKEGRYQVILKKVDMPIVGRGKCLAALRKTRLGQYFKLHESFICAGGEPNKDTCKGDGGSPLVCPIPSDKAHYQQAGIVAWGIGCGENNTPGVYANVALFRHWIDSTMIKNKFGTESYSRPY